MLTFLNKIFIWWNQETFGTKLKTILSGKFVGSDSFGNKYYQSKAGKRWIIYKGEIDASKIPLEWYSWIHFTNNRIENKHDLEIKINKGDIEFKNVSFKYDNEDKETTNPTLNSVNLK